MSCFVYKNKGGDTPRGRWLRRLDLPEKLIEHPDEVVIVHTTEDLGHKCATFRQKFDSQLQTHQHELRLRIGVLNPGGSDVGGTIVQYDVRLPVLEFAA